MEARGPFPSSETEVSANQAEALESVLWRLPFHKRVLAQLTLGLRKIIPSSRDSTTEEFTLGVSLFTLTSLLAGWVVIQNYSGDLFARSGLQSKSTANERDIASGLTSSGQNHKPSEWDDSPGHSEQTKQKKKSLILLAGGGCESASQNQFTQEFKRAIQDYQKSGVELRVLFGSPYTASSIRKSLGAPSRAFHARSFEEEVTRLVESNEWGSGDSLLIQLNTHGTQEIKDLDHRLCYDIPEDASVTTRGFLNPSDIRAAVQRLRNQHPDLKIAVYDQSCYSGALIEELKATPSVCTLSSISADLPAEFNEYFNHQFQRALSHGWNITRSFESALKDRYLRLRRNQDTPRLSGVPSADLQAFVDLIEWSGKASIQWENQINGAPQSQVERIPGVPDEFASLPNPEFFVQAAAALAGIDTEAGPHDFASTWIAADDVSEKLHALAFQRGSDGSAKSLKDVRALRRVAQRIRERIQRIKEHAEAISSKWVAAERNDDLRKGSQVQSPEERDWVLALEIKNDLSPLFLELGRLRLRFGDIYRLLRELDPDSLIRDSTGARQLEAWQACADFKLHVRLK